MSARAWMVVAAAYGVVAVVLGAFGAHALRSRVTPDMLAVWHTAVEYQFFHLLALFGVALLMLLRPAPWQSAAALCFAVGILLFSGSLYALVLSGVRVLGAITPLGGLLFIAGWVALLVSLLRG